MNSQHNCPDGFSPDLLYRLPLIPFDEPYGQDCYFSHLGYTIWGSLIIALNVFLLFLLGATIQSEKNKLLLALKISQCAVLVGVCVLIIMGWTVPRYFHFGWIIHSILFLFSGALVAAVGYFSMLKTVDRVELNKKITLTELVGGRVRFVIIWLMISCSLIAVTCGTIGVSIGLTRDPIDDQFAAIFYRLFSWSVVVSILAFTFTAIKILRKFTEVIDSVVASIPVQQADRTKELQDTSTRFKHAIKIIYMVVPLAISVWAAQGIFLPGFWFTFFLHYLNYAIVAFMIWHSVTSSEKKRRIFCRPIKKQTSRISSRNGSAGALVPKSSAEKTATSC